MLFLFSLLPFARILTSVSFAFFSRCVLLPSMPAFPISRGRNVCHEKTQSETRAGWSQETRKVGKWVRSTSPSPCRAWGREERPYCSSSSHTPLPNPTSTRFARPVLPINHATFPRPYETLVDKIMPTSRWGEKSHRPKPTKSLRKPHSSIIITPPWQPPPQPSSDRWGGRVLPGFCREVSVLKPRRETATTWNRTLEQM